MEYIIELLLIAALVCIIITPFVIIVHIFMTCEWLNKIYDKLFNINKH